MPTNHRKKMVELGYAPAHHGAKAAPMKDEPVAKATPKKSAVKKAVKK